MEDSNNSNLQNTFKKTNDKLSSAFDQNASVVAYIFAVIATFVPVVGTYIVRKDLAKENINKACGMALIQAIALFVAAIIPFLGWFVIAPLTYLTFIVLNVIAVAQTTSNKEF